MGVVGMDRFGRRVSGWAWNEVGVGVVRVGGGDVGSVLRISA
jgi:hypothetical protein